MEEDTVPPEKSTDGITRSAWSLDRLKDTLKKRLKLPEKFVVLDWQAVLIERILEGYDTIAVAGTGRGKSLIWEGFAAMKPKKTVVVIEPLKSVEEDMIVSAQDKGLNALVINQDTAKEGKVWQLACNVKTNVQLIYVAPEMARSVRFQTLLNNSTFRRRLALLVIDEAHCVHVWGGSKGFRPDYGELGELRAFMGFDRPLFACSATMDNETFQVVWKSLRYGHRPFWGIDVGSSRPDLSYSLWPMTSAQKPAAEIAKLLPQSLDGSSTAESLPKILIFEFSHNDCMELKKALWAYLPEHLEHCIQVYTSDVSSGGKRLTWDCFRNGEIRLVVATASAAMGCNISDIEIVVVNGAKVRTLQDLVQKFGRAARDRTMTGQGILLIPNSLQLKARKSANPPATLPIPNAGISAWKKPQKRKQSSLVPKESIQLQEPVPPGLKLAPNLERLINLQCGNGAMGDGMVEANPAIDSASISRLPLSAHSDRLEACIHNYLDKAFRPVTGLVEYRDLQCIDRLIRGRTELSDTMRFISAWVVLDICDGLGVDRADIKVSQCCSNCHPILLAVLKELPRPRAIEQSRELNNLPGNGVRELRLQELSPAAGFQQGDDGSEVGDGMDGHSEVGGADSEAELEREQRGRVDNNLLPGRKHGVLDTCRADLRARVLCWRDSELEKTEGWSQSAEYILPNAMIKRLVENCGYFVGDNPPITLKSLRHAMKWDLAGHEQLLAVAELIREWAPTVMTVNQTPRRGEKRKQARVGSHKSWVNLTEGDFSRYPFEEGLATSDFTSMWSTPSYSKRWIDANDVEQYMASLYPQSKQARPKAAHVDLVEDAFLTSSQADPFTDFPASQETLISSQPGPSSSQSVKPWIPVTPASVPRRPVLTTKTNLVTATNVATPASGAVGPARQFTFIDCSPAFVRKH